MCEKIWDAEVGEMTEAIIFIGSFLNVQSIELLTGNLIIL